MVVMVVWSRALSSACVQRSECECTMRSSSACAQDREIASLARSLSAREAAQEHLTARVRKCR